MRDHFYRRDTYFFKLLAASRARAEKAVRILKKQATPEDLQGRSPDEIFKDLIAQDGFITAKCTGTKSLHHDAL